MYLQSIHLTRLLSRLITVKSLQSEWRITELFSAECGASLNSSRVASAELNVYPYIIPGKGLLHNCEINEPSFNIWSSTRYSHLRNVQAVTDCRTEVMLVREDRRVRHAVNPDNWARRLVWRASSDILAPLTRLAFVFLDYLWKIF